MPLVMKFYVINNTSWKLPEAFLQWNLKHFTKALKVRHAKDLKKQLGIVLVGNEEIRRLNRKYRGKNKITDVLSFATDEKGGPFLGDIVLCVPRIQKQARQHQLHDVEEFSYLLLHGLLHLLGYDHEKSAAEEKKMFRLQDKLFADLQDRDILGAVAKISQKSGQKVRRKSGKKA